MKIFKATRKYESWLDEHVPLVRSDLELKHGHLKIDSEEACEAILCAVRSDISI